MRPDEYWKMLDNRALFYRQKIGSIVSYTTARGMTPVERLISRKVPPDAAVLEVGSGNNALMERMKRAGHRGIYHTLDPETRYPHDFHRLEEVRDRYDFVLLLEIIEHLPLEEFYRYLDFVQEHLKPGGTIVISTPNASHLNVLWKGDMTHVRPYPLRDLFALLTARGFRAEMYRIHVVEEHYGPFRWIRRRIAQLLAWILYAEIHEGVLILGTKA